MTATLEPHPPDRSTSRAGTLLPWAAHETIVDYLDDRASRSPDRPAMRSRHDTHWKVVTWGEYGRAVREVAAGLYGLGVAPGDRVAILAANSPEWHVADFAILWSGAVTVPVYPTSAPEQVEYVITHSGARVCFVERALVAKVLDRRDRLPLLERIVLLDGPVRQADPLLAGFDEIRALGVETLGRDALSVNARRATVTPDDLATLVYTSGTTGPPKGTMITHANIMATMRSITAVVPLTEQERFLSFLPLSHITERSVSHFGLVLSGGETWFARGITTVGEDLPDCRPTIFFAVPRVWEKFREAIEEQVESMTGPRGAIARRYLALVARRAELDAQGATLPRADAVTWRALDAVVGASIRRTAGLDHARLLVSGAAPVHPDLLRWFDALGLPIAEGYGQTEVSLATTLNPPGAIRIGTVGRPLPGITVRVADDDEILVRGDNVCAGYYHDEAATRDLIDRDGWLHSGDLGRLDADGYLHITGRKKDLIITAHGKNIAPQVLETDLRAEPLIAHAVVVGDGRRYLTALLALDPEELAHWARERGKPYSPASLAGDPDVHTLVAEGVERVNARHARVEQIKKWRILPGELSIAAGELTPTLKVKRGVVNERYASLIEELYADDDTD